MIKNIFSNNCIKLFLIMLFIVLPACSVDRDNGRDSYFVLSDGAKIPVYIKGPNTQKVVLFVHGGPAASSVIYSHMPIFKKLSEKFRFVFWDQRGGGGSRGHATEDSINLPQFVKDMDAVYQSVMARYPSSKIYVMGHSFGGFIGGAYVSKYNNKVQASIFGAPAFNILEVRQIVSGMMLNFIDEHLNSDLSAKDRKFWKKARQFYLDNPILQAKDLLIHLNYADAVDKARGNTLMNDYLKSNAATFIHDNILDGIDLFPQMKEVIAALGKNNTGNINLSTDTDFGLYKITTPMLLFTGARDLTIPEITSIHGYETLNGGVTLSNSQKISIPDSSHQVFLKGEYLFDTIVNFINNN